ncbi:hypothetical protein B7R22_16855 [Subtercola boreus]|uniref:Uncharacterized protein n=1 Tax=Subtercola boreus TaxID=120213 RepID=A0A3E0VRS5_9MICO|nr:hypothetical protein [Subtercola boreus]RFA12103.1 hypothetical protein B7R22_16855 [Subtercola boreus]
MEPGGVKTEMSGHGIERAKESADQMAPAQRDVYGDLMQAIINEATSFTKSGVIAGAHAAALVSVIQSVTDATGRAILDGSPRKEAAALMRDDSTVSLDHLAQIFCST